ncbi:hypothetical protein AB0H42_24365 [Nocardia sp. NPDC050799]|uniref:hypothetical protein n=1 Tax=Nocardia sp. NPDC050799 TaxID=3154842 RepID=UPI0033E43C5C
MKLADLFIIDDSDDLSSGEATFSLVVRRGPNSSNTQSFGATVDSGTQVIGIPSTMQMDTGLEKVPSFGDIYIGQGICS